MQALPISEGLRFPCEVAVAGEVCALDLAGVLYLVDHRALVVADLHLEKGSSFARRGALLPPYDTRSTLAALAAVIARYAPAEVIALGDSFHDVGGPARLDAADRGALAALQRGRGWTWVAGNHDRELPADIGGEVAAERRVGRLTLRHEPRPGAAAELAGHLHPVGKVALRGRGVRRRAFLSDGARCVMPAFGAYAGGLNACDPVFRPLFPRGFTAHLVGAERLYAIGSAQLCRD